jgi:invasion protein IalB
VNTEEKGRQRAPLFFDLVFVGPRLRRWLNYGNKVLIMTRDSAWYRGRTDTFASNIYRRRDFDLTPRCNLAKEPTNHHGSEPIKKLGAQMKLLIKFAAMAIALSFASPSLAQQKPAAPADGFPIGTAPEIKVGQTYVKKTIGAWDVRCVKVKEGPEACHIYQLLKDKDGNSVAEISFFHLPGGGTAILGATVVTPLGTMLQNQLVFKVDGGSARQYPFGWCETGGCVARMGFTGLELEGLRKGKQASVTISSVVDPTKPITLTISLKGFADGFSAVLVKP